MGSITEKEPKLKQTTRIFIGLAVLGILCLLAAYVYDLRTNSDQDKTRKADISYIANYLNDYYRQNRSYPTLSQINSLKTIPLKLSINRNKLIDPSSTSRSTILTKNPTDTSYGYQVNPAGCNILPEFKGDEVLSVPCTAYKLAAILTSGQEYVVTSPSGKG